MAKIKQEPTPATAAGAFVPPHYDNPTPRQVLILAGYHYARKKYPSIPADELYSIHKNKPRKLNETNGLTWGILDYITYTGGFANRINVIGRTIKTKSVKTATGGIIEGKQVRIKSTTKRGTPDIDAVYNGKAIKIEVKNAATKDSSSSHQTKVQEQLQEAGAIYFIAESIESFLHWWDTEILKANAA